VTDSRPPYRAALGVSLAILIGYLATLAPTVTFWDAGEFITGAKTLGIPHPPGTPLFVLIANVWGRLVPFGTYAWRINLLSAMCSAAAAGFWFLVGQDMIVRLHPDVDDKSRAALAVLGGAAAALLASFSFSTWQSATEAEVYASAVLGIAMIAWIATRWRVRRLDAAGSRLLLLALYLGALAVGNHILGLLVGPALIALLIVEARRVPLHTDGERASEWAQIWVISAAWILLIGVGLGNGIVALLGGLLLTIAAVRAQRARQLAFALLAMVVVAAGVSTLLFLLLRARQQPWLNSGNASTWHGVLDMVRRTQYPVRTPLDDPTAMHGAGNPGRTLALLAYQVANYAQYFDWQWASGLGDLALKSYPRLAITLLFATLGIRGAFAQRRADPASFGLVAALFFMAGPALVLYLNFRPGPSIGWDRWLHGIDHEVRDRDYFFVASFVAWGIWVAIALAEIARNWIPRVQVRWRPVMSVVFAVALLPGVCNFPAATRRQTPDATLARDFARALLQSVPPNSVLFTNGDNDTFPVWYAQQVEGFRTDVTVVCLSMAPAPLYVDDLRRSHGVIYDQIDSLIPFRASRDLTVPLERHAAAHIAAGTLLSSADILVIEVLRASAGRRPIVWTLGGADELLGLGPQLVQEGIGLVLPVVPTNTAALTGGAAAGPGGVLLDLPATRRLIDGWWFGRLESGGFAQLDANIQVVARAVAAPMTQTGIGLTMRGDTAAGVAMLRRALRLADDSLAKATLRQIAP
jgi:hypothetical protein